MGRDHRGTPGRVREERTTPAGEGLAEAKDRQQGRRGVVEGGERLLEEGDPSRDPPGVARINRGLDHQIGNHAGVACDREPPYE